MLYSQKSKSKFSVWIPESFIIYNYMFSYVYKFRDSVQILKPLKNVFGHNAQIKQICLAQNYYCKVHKPP
jgi:hypothetical protein